MNKLAVSSYDPSGDSITSPNGEQPRHIIIVGSGPVGVRFANELLQSIPCAKVTLFGNEPHAPYNRVQLSNVLAGETARNGIDLLLPDPLKHPAFSFQICAIVSIDRHRKCIIDALGNRHDYHTLVLATGSRPFVPSIPGIQQPGVYTFRNLKDTDSLYARISSSKHIVVVGGGLLGLEAARALQRFNTSVTIIHQGPRLMNRQLDDESANQLLSSVTRLGIRVIVDSGVRVVHGDNRVNAVTTRNREKIICDTVLFCTGVTANSELARHAKLKVGRGIIVDNQLRSSDPDIYAIGECCEHNGLTYGLVSPGLEQAAILANVLGHGDASYTGSQQVAQLKVLGERVISIGEVADFGRHGLQRELVYQQQDCYRKLIVHRGTILGAVAIGEWPELRRVQEVFHGGERIPLWRQYLFRLTGQLWFDRTGRDVNFWPATATVCQCNNISQGSLVEAIGQGSTSFDSLCENTTAGTVCGSCRPLLQQLLGDQGPLEKTTARIPILFASLVAILLVPIIFWLPGITISDTVQESAALQTLWNDKFWKQITGFTLLGLSLLGLLMSLRKKINSKRLGGFAYWRLLHVLLGVSCAVLVIVHTGFHLGANLNRLLIIDFLLVIGLGALAGLMLAFSHRFSPVQSQRYSKTLSWFHLLVSWPLPVLLASHILSVYYF